MALPDPRLVSGPAGERLSIPTHVSPEGGETTHPSVVYIAEGWNGYRYWMAHTPYPAGDDDYEDPNIAVSNDGINWDVPLGLVNPLDDQPGSPGAYNSDTDLRMGPDDTLYLFWRTFDPAATGAEESIYYRWSVDGVTWSDKALVYSSDMTVRRLLSPSFHYEAGVWHMWAVDIVGSPNTVVRLTGAATPAGPWSTPTGVDMGPMLSGKEPWHISVHRTTDGYLAMLNDANEDLSGINGQLLFCVSSDGWTFENSGRTVIPQERPGQYEYLYRATLVPEQVGNVLGWRVWYGAWLPGVTQVWYIYRTWVTAGQLAIPDAGGPTGTPAVAEPLPTITWLACDLMTGEAITYVSGVSGDIARSIAAYESATLTIPTPLSGPLANRLINYQVTAPNTVLVAVINNVPAWSGIVWATEESSDGGYTLSTATPESFLDNVYTRDLTFTQVEQVDIVKGLAQRAVNNGLPLVFDLTPSGIKRDRTYHDDEDATVYERMQELYGVIGGPEWTIDTAWADDSQRRIQFVLRCGATIGAGIDYPKGPISTHGPAKATWKLTTSWGKGKGANAIIATASGEGEDRLQSEEISDILDGYPKVEYRWMPSSSIKEKGTLNDHADARLTKIGRGTRVLELECRWDQAPVRLELDISLGDWIAYQLYGPSRPAGMNGTERMMGWRLSTSSGRVQPFLLGGNDR